VTETCTKTLCKASQGNRWKSLQWLSETPTKTLLQNSLCHKRDLHKDSQRPVQRPSSKLLTETETSLQRPSTKTLHQNSLCHKRDVFKDSDRPLQRPSSKPQKHRPLLKRPSTKTLHPDSLCHKRDLYKDSPRPLQRLSTKLLRAMDVDLYKASQGNTCGSLQWLSETQRPVQRLQRPLQRLSTKPLRETDENLYNDSQRPLQRPSTKTTKQRPA